jgi:cyanophycin synthetase
LKSRVAALREGLGFDCREVAVVTNIGSGDHRAELHHHGEDLAVLKCDQAERRAHYRLRELNVADAIVTGWLANCPARQDLLPPTATTR